MSKLEIARAGAAQEERQNILNALAILGARCRAGLRGPAGEHHAFAIENCITTIRNLPLCQKGDVVSARLLARLHRDTRELWSPTHSECEGCGGLDSTVAVVDGRYYCAACSPDSHLTVRWKHTRAMRHDAREAETIIDALLEGDTTEKPK